ncbi:MAG: ATP-dependent 6-phosphofructokinase, partial [Lentisphaerae bacterium]|nr:ATP-dependent 6-phosphofructokinase [Lentisphaerota bacterium]
MPDRNEFAVPTLGPADVDTPLDRAVFMDRDSRILVDARLPVAGDSSTEQPSMEMAGARRQIFFDPSRTKAAIVTCGGLCPGLNDVIRAITMVLWYRYGVGTIEGLRYGYEGLVEAQGHEPMVLTPETVADIHKDGGTVLGSSRGPQDVGAMADFLASRGINILFTVGGDGTQRGALALSAEIRKRGLNVAVVGIPKTIDNDISFTERTFGFETAVAMSRPPITGAHMEAKGVRNGVGLVKLMGRESGFVAAHAALASSDVNLVLVPEVPFSLERLLAFLEARLEEKSHAVIVVAEGAGQDLVPRDGADASGNRSLGDIGTFLRSAILQHFREKQFPCSVKYIDPSYTIRSAPASADDSVFCFRLAENAVHAAMAGRTEMVVSLWNGHFVHVPMQK